MAAAKNNLKISDKTVLLLTNFFLPMRFILPTIEDLIKNKNKVIVVSEFGEAGLESKARELAETLKRKYIDLPAGSPRLPEYGVPHLYFVREPRVLSGMRAGDIAVLENLKLISKETISKLSFAAQVFVNDDFFADNSLQEALKSILPAEPGLVFVRTEKKLKQFLSRSKKPIILVLGGVRLAGKEHLLDKLMSRADTVLAGGGAANIFLKLRGFSIGNSAIDPRVDEQLVKKLLRDHGSKIKLPLDLVIGTPGGGSVTCKQPEKIGPQEMILDIGPQTTLEFSKILKAGQTLLWCGALGRIEEANFRHGTEALLRLAVSRTALPGRVCAASGEAISNLLEAQGFTDDLDLAVPRTLGFLQALTA